MENKDELIGYAERLVTADDKKEMVLSFERFSLFTFLDCYLVHILTSIVTVILGIALHQWWSLAISVVTLVDVFIKVKEFFSIIIDVDIMVKQHFKIESLSLFIKNKTKTALKVMED